MMDADQKKKFTKQWWNKYLLGDGSPEQMKERAENSIALLLAKAKRSDLTPQEQKECHHVEVLLKRILATLQAGGSIKDAVSSVVPDNQDHN